MAQETPNVAHAFCSYVATNPLGQNTPTTRPYGRILAQAGIREVIECAPSQPGAPEDFGGLYIVRMMQQITDEEGNVEIAVFPDMNKDKENQPSYPGDGFELDVPATGVARIVRAYAVFNLHPLDAGPVAPAFVADNPNEWVIAVQTAIAGSILFRQDWSIAVQQSEVAGNKVGGEGSIAPITPPFVQPPT